VKITAMAGGAVSPAGSVDARRVEAPVTVKTYLMCAFAAFGGIFFGYDSGYISGVLGMDFFIATFEDLVSMATAKIENPHSICIAVYSYFLL
jgi:hypothetical protein